MTIRPDTAFVLAAGLGTRMRPLTDTTPKPLIEIAGRSLLDRGLDVLAAAGVTRAVVNAHWLGEQIIAHAPTRRDIAITVSDERAELLDSAGGIVKALPLLGKDPFFILNADTFWLDGAVPALPSMAKAWDDATMDMILLLADPAHATGHTGGTDFLADPAGRLSRARGSAGGYIYAGAALIHPRVFSNAPAGPHSLNLHFDRLIGEGRLFGHVMDGQWITVGTPDAIAPAEEAIRRHGRA
ncbi:MAG: mannose-1-phosphate guanylyltransferase [Phyllobacteriaceae bacterium]|nr:mannose-1-phosphate guanylyltransferase [Phyllobacteriaceae bacterium]MBA90215.1 mannose-1-phosphate guanylyltransferase [Phyllobacteriaceae bacterium]